jgi:hypothetical protein
MIVRINVPVAKDGTYFHPGLMCNGVFTVGDKLMERKFSDFNEALAYLKSQPQARWRRPNSKGNRGIVTAAAWEDRNIDFSASGAYTMPSTVIKATSDRRTDAPSQDRLSA